MNSALKWIFACNCIAVLHAVLSLQAVAQDVTQLSESVSNLSSVPSKPLSKFEVGQVQTEASRVYIFVDKKGFGHQHGVEGTLTTSSLLLGAQSKAGQLVFNMTTFDADSPQARTHFRLEGKTDTSTRSKVNENMRAYVLKPEQFPTATFTIDSALATGENSPRGLAIYQLIGRFTLCGQSRSLTVPVDVEMTRGWLHIRGSFQAKQTDYGITPYSTALGAVGVADLLRIDGDLFVAPDGSQILDDIPVRRDP